MNAIVVRRATTEDAEGIGRVHVLAWQQTYSRLVAPGELDDLPVQTRIEGWRRIVGEARSQVHVAESGGEIVGFVATGGFREHDRPREVELEALYLLAGSHGSGAGQLLLDAAIGDSPAFLFVAADNPRAARFYERNGFAFDGVTESYPLVRTPIVSRRMVR